MSSVTINWNMFSVEDPFFDIAIDHKTLLSGSWADCEDNGDAAANNIVADYFLHEPDVWNDVFGQDTDGDVILHVTSPKSIAGFYAVTVTHPPKASAQKIQDPRT